MPVPEKTHHFVHEKLDVYKAAVKVVVLIDEVVNQFLRDQSDAFFRERARARLRSRQMINKIF